ncbi:MAG TPA: DUF3300 domain-containing protein [Rhizomicrobium sp.]|nr:DUF3300 domain-containing protein [Rhizomicrobium sp.]
MTSLRLKVVAAALIGTASMFATGGLAQDVTVPPQTALAPADTAPLAAQQMDQLVAPVALYDDPLLIEVLTASSHPVHVVEAQGWVANPLNAALKGNALATALANQKWDPSVKALVPFPPILNLMYDHLDWTEHLGDAFVANRAAVVESIQRMRRRAESAGTLKSSAQQIVVDDGGFVTITPPVSEIYIPAYDPWCVYGSWPVSAPFFYTSWPGYCTANDGLLDFGVGFHRPFGYWRRGDFDWLHHDIRIYHNRSSHFDFGQGHMGATSRHDGLHQVGVRLGDRRSVDRFGGGHLGNAGFGAGHFGGSSFGGGRLDGLGAGHFGSGGIGGGHGGGGGGRR